MRLAHRWFPLSMVGCLVVVACSGSESSDDSNPTTSASATISTTSTPTSSPATATTAVPVEEVAAGVQFLSAPTDGEVYSTIEPVEGASVTVEAMGSVLVVTAADGTTRMITLDQAAAPTGYPFPASPFSVTSVAFSDLGGFVAVGRGWFRQFDGISEASHAATIWHSADGSTWQVVDLSSSIGDQAAELNDVVATADGFVAIGEVGLLGSTGKSRPLVLTSTDGTTWLSAPAPALAWSGGLDEAFMFRDSVLLRGNELICGDDGGDLRITGFFGRQERLWHTTDDGASWLPVDLTASGALATKDPAPVDPTGCTVGGVAVDPNATWFQPVRSVSVTEGHVAVWSATGETIAVTTDLSTWTTGGVPGARATVGIGPVQSPQDTLVTEHNGLLTAVSLENGRNEDGEQMSSRFATMVWTSDDEGATWDRHATHGRVLALGDRSRLTTDDDAVVVTTADPFRPAGALVYRSEAGPANDDTTCTPEAGADCFGLRLDEMDLSDADLTGIDLRMAVVRDVDLSGAILVSARFGGAIAIDTTVFGADFTNASVAAANLGSIDWTGAKVAGVNFADAFLSVSLLGADGLESATLNGASLSAAENQRAGDYDVSGLDLSGVRISAAISAAGPWPVVLRAAGTNFTGAYFLNVDLTGSDLATALLDPVFIGAEVICPDGLPTDPNALDAAVCRL